MNDEQLPADETPADRVGHDGLLGRVEVIESQPLADRAAGFEQLHDELLQELQRSDTAARTTAQHQAQERRNAR